MLISKTDIFSVNDCFFVSENQSVRCRQLNKTTEILFQRGNTRLKASTATLTKIQYEL